MTTSLFDIVETLRLEAQTIDSLFRNKPRYLFNLYAKEGMKKIGLTFGLNVKGMNFYVPSSCDVYKPEGYEAFVRAYLINCDGKTIELNLNNKVPSEIKNFLVNCDGSLLTDCDETNLQTDCLVCNSDGSGSCIDSCCTSCQGTGKCCPSEIEQLLADIEKYKNSWIKEHSDRFEFSADLEGMAVVIEYISNQTAGIEECAIHLDEKYTILLEYYIKYRLLESGQETLQQAQYFRKRYKELRDAETVKQNPISNNDILSILTMT